MLQDNVLEISYTTPSGSRGCYKFLVNTDTYIIESFFAVQTQAALKQVFEAVTWTQDAAGCFADIDNFYKTAIEKTKENYWYFYIDRESKRREQIVTALKAEIETSENQYKSLPAWDAMKTATAAIIQKLKSRLESAELYKEGFKKVNYKIKRRYKIRRDAYEF